MPIIADHVTRTSNRNNNSFTTLPPDDIRSVRRSRGLIVVVVCFAVLQASGFQAANAQDFEGLAVFAAIEDSITKIVEKSEKSVVAIARIKDANRAPMPRQAARNPFGIQDPVQSSNPQGKNFFPKDFATGIVVAPKDRPRERFILTNYHSVKGGHAAADKSRNIGYTNTTERIHEFPISTHSLYVRFSRHQGARATIYAADPRSDLAILRIEMPNLESVPAISLDVTPEIKKGQFCISLNNPFAIARDGSPSVSIGLISNVSRFPFAESRQEKTKSIHFYGTLLHVDTRLGPGASGGALLNRKGELIGITTSMTAIQGYESNVGFAIPFNQGTRRVVNDLLKGYEVEYGFLGVQLSSRKVHIKFYGDGVPQRIGVLAEKVVANSPAARGGLHTGDIIMMVNNRKLYDEDDLFREVGFLSPGTIANMRVRRGERELNLRIRLGKFPSADSKQIIIARQRIPDWRGMRVDWPTARQKYVDYEKPYPRAVVVTKVREDSATHTAGLREEDLIAAVNGRAVETPSDFALAIRNLTGDVRLRTLSGKEFVVHR